jgi:hypothetical protein
MGRVDLKIIKSVVKWTSIQKLSWDRYSIRNDNSFIYSQVLVMIEYPIL